MMAIVILSLGDNRRYHRTLRWQIGGRVLGLSNFSPHLRSISLHTFMGVKAIFLCSNEAMLSVADWLG